LVIKHRIDGEMDRFDITFPKDDPRAAAAQQRSELPLNATVWADAHTHLIRRVDLTTKETHVDGQITYGPPAIKDLYDVGVPSAAKVVNATRTTQASP